MTTKQERKENAVKFYETFMRSNCNKAAVVVKRLDSKNQAQSKCQFLAVISTLAHMESPVIIAESEAGIDGCFKEFLKAIKPCIPRSYWDDDFSYWLKENFLFEITYKDGFVFMFEK